MNVLKGFISSVYVPVVTGRRGTPVMTQGPGDKARQ